MADGRYLEVNDAFERMYGYSRAEALGRTELELDLWVDPDERTQLLDEIRTSGLVVDREVHVRHRSGTVFPVLVWVTPIELQGKPCLISMGMDITERKANERLLRLNQFALEKAVDEVYYIRQDGRFQYVNDAACRALEYRREELLAMTVPEVDPLFSAGRWREHWQALKVAGSLTLETLHSSRVVPKMWT
jgi:PAS domain S-box-containing protein